MFTNSMIDGGEIQGIFKTLVLTLDFWRLWIPFWWSMWTVETIFFCQLGTKYIFASESFQRRIFWFLKLILMFGYLLCTYPSEQISTGYNALLELFTHFTNACSAGFDTYTTSFCGISGPSEYISAGNQTFCGIWYPSVNFPWGLWIKCRRCLIPCLIFPKLIVVY
jgi:hypothetical protein